MAQDSRSWVGDSERRALGGAALLASLLVLASCSTRPATEVMVFVDAEPGVRAAAVSLDVLIEGSGGRSGAAAFAQREHSSVPAPHWPVRIALAPLDGDGQRVYRVTATAQDGAATPALVAQVRVVSGYRPGESVRIDLLLEDSCLHHPACPDDETCAGGSCMMAMIDPATLRPIDSDASHSDGGHTEDSGMDAATDGGVELDANLPDAVVTIDAGMDGGGPIDGGVDAGTDSSIPDGGVDGGLDGGSDGGLDGGSVAVDGGTITGTQEATLVAADTAPSDHFGYAVSLSGDGSRVLIGAYSDTTAGGSAAGSARVFVRAGTTWTEEATLLATGGAANDQFGWHVALSEDGTRALVGAPYDDTARGTDAGTARVFVRSGSTWTEEATLSAADGAMGDGFGIRVALDRDATRAVIGAQFDGTAAGAAAGSARVFVRSGTTWTAEATLLASDAAAGDNLGSSVALSADGTRAIVGAGIDDTPRGVNAGSAHVYLRTGTTWSEETILIPAVGVANDEFGHWSVALSSDGSRALIGEPSDHSAPLGGTAHVFARSGVTWTEEATLRASDAAINDQFGQGASLSADGSRALIGVQGDDGDQGSGRLFVRTGTTWTASVTLVASDRVVESLGISAALSADGTRAALGTFTSSAPRVKVFVLAGP